MGNVTKTIYFVKGKISFYKILIKATGKDFLGNLLAASQSINVHKPPCHFANFFGFLRIVSIQKRFFPE
jgi:hypothetical protein